LVDWEERLTALEKKFIERGYDTRPAFEALDQRLTTLEAKVASLSQIIPKLLHNAKLFRDGHLIYVEWHRDIHPI